MKSILTVVIILNSIIALVITESAAAKELSNRLGVGFRDAYSFSLPSISTIYYPSSSWGMVGAIGIDTVDQSSSFALSGGARKIIFTEDNMNFFMGGMLSMLNQQTATAMNSGFEIEGLVGGEFFLTGLDNLGFSFETGVAVSSMNKVRFRTVGDSFLRAGITFYF